MQTSYISTTLRIISLRSARQEALIISISYIGAESRLSPLQQRQDTPESVTCLHRLAHRLALGYPELQNLFEVDRSRLRPVTGSCGFNPRV